MIFYAQVGNENLSQKISFIGMSPLLCGILGCSFSELNLHLNIFPKGGKLSNLMCVGEDLPLSYIFYIL